MAVFVDEIRAYGYGPSCLRNGASHLTADTLEELHAMAAAIGLRPTWFQGQGNTPHYDVNPARRARALALGAVFKPGRQQAQERIEARKKERHEGQADRLSSVEGMETPRDASLPGVVDRPAAQR